VNQHPRLLEAALFSAAHPLSLSDLKKLMHGAATAEVRAALDELRDHYDHEGHGVELVEVADGFQIMTRSEHAEAIADARIVIRPRKLSRAALETLAVIAYRQPVSRGEIGVLRMLLDREFVQIAGRAEGLGRPLLYGTTPKFLELLGLTEISALPQLEEFSVALRPPTEGGEP
jgi:segregation and condensation protein B